MIHKPKKKWEKTGLLYDKKKKRWILTNDQFGHLIDHVAFSERSKVLEEVREKTIKEVDNMFAYCSCGDTLERIGLYPEDAEYYCIGCNETYVLKKLK